MKKFITYFDFIGFKKFILNNETAHINKRIKHILRDIEFSICQRNLKKTDSGVIANLDNSRINCLIISDTIIFWTNDNSLDSFNELLKISFNFNMRVTCNHFPVRGAIVFDEIEIISGFNEAKNGGTYNVNSIYGKGLIKAYLKAEDLNFASCVIDKSVVEKIQEFGNLNDIIGKFIVDYKVPYKKSEISCNEFVLKFFLDNKISKDAYKNLVNDITNAFKGDNKEMDLRSEEILKNTIEFVGILKE